MNDPGTHEEAAEAADIRKARFGSLPDRVPFEDMVEERAAVPKDRAVDAYDPDRMGVVFSCLAVDLGL
ncbi:hypothetical protein AB0F11_29910 [Streptomyces sp. NPDC032472]|uniref:hypothetical protein n=1 Tax=Streptomyces sp. NPDC032472 TaxID=3155018 RepID=UPI0033DABE6D